MKRPEKMVQTKEEDNSDWFYGYGYNQAIEKSEAYNKWVLEPVVGVFEKYKDSNLGFCDYYEGQTDEIIKESWNAIQKTIKRSKGE